MRLQTRSIVRNVDVDGPRSITSYNPATEEEIATVSALDGDGAADAVEAAKEAFPDWSHTPVRERQKILARWLEIMLDERDELAKLVSMEGGKPVSEAGLVDVFPGLESLAYYSKYIDKMLAFREVKPNQILFRHWRSGYRFDPLGVIGIITPWNYPVIIPMGEIVPAVGAGNTVVFKPASATMLIGLKLGDMARRAGLPPGVLNTVALPGSATDALLDHPDVAKILFTGSVDIGRHVGRRCADRIAPAQLELGGKDAAVVAADAEIERTARGLVWAAFVNTGQTCASVERVYVERPIYDRLLHRIVELTDEIKVGDPSLPDTDMGPLTTKGQLDIVSRQVEEAVVAGARALTGGTRPDGRGFFYPPTVLVDVNDDMELMREETFGPVMPVIPVNSLEEGIRRANESAFGLTASGWTRSKKTAARLQRELDAGTVTINDHLVTAGEATGSWGGVRDSGIGRTHGQFGLYNMVNIKYVMRDPGTDDAMPWYYPYDRDFGQFLGAAMPLMYRRGLGKFSTVFSLARTKRFWQRVRKSTLLANLHKLF